MIIAHVPGIDLGKTGAAPVTDIARSLDADAPIVLINAKTGEHPAVLRRARFDRRPTYVSACSIIRPAPT